MVSFSYYALPGYLFTILTFFSWLLTLPIGVIQETTNQEPGYDIIVEYMFGYIWPGKSIVNLLLNIYSRRSSINALSFLADLKLGNYMKIPLHCMYSTQLVGTVVVGIVNLGVEWWIVESIENIYDGNALPPNVPWTCSKYRETFDASVIWVLVGTKHIFGQHGLYRNVVWLFLVGAFLPVSIWILSKLFPKKK